MNTKLLTTDIILENDTVLLIPFKNKRHIELKNIIFEKDIWKYMGMYIENDLDFNAYIKNTIKDSEIGNCYPFLIIDKRTNKVAGSTRYGNINVSSEKCEIGWTWYGKDFQGTGLNKSCKYELLKFGFENIKLRRIQFSADTENIRSQKAIKKLGAKKEGIFKNNYIDASGKSKDDIYFSIIKQEWDATKIINFKEFI